MAKMYRFKNVSNEMMARAQRLIRENGGEMNESAFRIRGVQGRYEKDGRELVVAIDDKPLLASWVMIEEKLREIFK